MLSGGDELAPPQLVPRRLASAKQAGELRRRLRLDCLLWGGVFGWIVYSGRLEETRILVRMMNLHYVAKVLSPVPYTCM